MTIYILKVFTDTPVPKGLKETKKFIWVGQVFTLIKHLICLMK